MLKCVFQVQKSYGSPELASRIVPQSSLPFPGVAVCNVPSESPDLQPNQGNCFVTQDAVNAVQTRIEFLRLLVSFFLQYYLSIFSVCSERLRLERPTLLHFLRPAV
jgi:hypothetical protein